MSSANQEQYLGITEQLARRAEQDKNSAQHAKANPVGTLTAAGIPQRAIPDLLGEGAQSAEVAGYKECVDLTCIITDCPDSCIVTLPY